MSIKITSDSTCDLPAALLQAHGIDLFPLYILRGDKPYRDGLEIFPADVFAHVDAGGDICTTSGVNLSDYMRKFRSYSEEYEAVIHINISSDFSCCYQNASLAAAALPNVYVVDSRNLSSGHGLLVLAAAELAESGMAAAEIVAELEELTKKISASFVLGRLDYMRKGGRCSAVTVLGANLLKLKPCIEVVDGKMHVGKKYRGSMTACVRAYIADRLRDRDAIRPQRVFITHSLVPEEVLEAAFAAVREFGDFAEIVDADAGCTISCHCGPGTLGILYVLK